MNEEFERRLRRNTKIAKAINRKARESGRTEATGRDKVALIRLNGQTIKDLTQSIGDDEE
jgi:hypothetical protein